MGLPSARRARGRDLTVAMLLLTLAVGAGLGLYRLVALEPAPDEPIGFILRTDPVEDVAIYVDGRLVSERSPVVVRDLAEGTHEVRVDRPGFETWNLTLTLDQPGLQEVLATLQPVRGEPARLRFVTKPADADLYLDGRLVDPGQRNRGVELPGGQPVDVSVRREGFKTHTERVVPESGASRTVSVELTPTDGTLIVDSHPPGEVYLDGRRVGRTPYTQSGVDVRRSWTLEVRRPGMPTWRQTLRFGGKRYLQIDVDQ